MKQFGKVGMGRRFLAIIIAAISLVLNGCLKEDNQVYQVSAVRALNAVPGSEQLDVFLDQNKFNFDNTVWQDEDFAYTDTLPYKNVWPNNRLVSVVDPVDYPNAKPLVQKTINFRPGGFYSLYVVGGDDMEVLSTEDDLSDPAAGKVKIRFIHLSPGAPALDFEVRKAAGDSLLINDIAFKEVADFVAVDEGLSYTVSFIAHGSGKVLHTFEFTPGDGMIYTVWVKGLLGNTADPILDFGHGIIVH